MNPDAVFYWLGVATSALGTLMAVLGLLYHVIERLFRLKEHFDLYIEFCVWRSKRKRDAGTKS